MQGLGKAAYSADNIVSDMKLIKAEIVSGKDIHVALSFPAQVEASLLQGFSMMDADGMDREIESVTDTGPPAGFEAIKDGYTIGYAVTMADTIDLSKKYVISKQGVGSAAVTIGNIFDSEDFAELYTYEGDDLGAVYSKDSTAFRLWAPTASHVNLLLYDNGEVMEGDAPFETIPMRMDVNGTWVAKPDGDLKNKYYIYEVDVNGETGQGVDPYAKAVGVNGLRAMVVDLAGTDPAGFRSHTVPGLASPTDAVIYELHVRDLSMHPHSGVQARGKFLGLTETGTVNDEGLPTGLDHIVDLGVTHVHLLPSFDFKTIDETKLAENKFNWGYDPQNYNTPEGSYATDPYDGNVRVSEFKQLVQALHENGLRVVMDVVYNHTFTVNDSNLNIIVPNYYYRTDENGNFTNGSGCGNETASERAMVRKLIVDSVVYWANEYRIDGFRFDLMGVHDIGTMNEVRVALNEIDPTIIVYGEGWTGGPSPLPRELSAVKANMPKLDTGIATFSDDIRDGIKGSVFEEKETGFVNGGKKGAIRDEDVKFGIVASVEHPGIAIGKVNYSSDFWALEPTQAITYASAHDNLTLWDKLRATNKLADDEELIMMNKLSAAIVLTSQGIPFFQAGEEIARSKKGNENSYESPDSINQIDWGNKTKYLGLYNYYKGLIALRKQYPAFRLASAEGIRKNITFLETEAKVIAYTLGNPEGEGYPRFTVIFNGSAEGRSVALPHGAWDVLVNGSAAGTEILGKLAGNKITVPATTALVLGEIAETANSAELLTEEKSTSPAQIEVEGAASPGGSTLRTIVTILRWPSRCSL